MTIESLTRPADTRPALRKKRVGTGLKTRSATTPFFTHPAHCQDGSGRVRTGGSKDQDTRRGALHHWSASHAVEQGSRESVLAPSLPVIPAAGPSKCLDSTGTGTRPPSVVANYSQRGYILNVLYD